MPPPPGQEFPPMSPRLHLGLALVFFALGLLLIWRHELWQDEWQAWLLARDSASMADLFKNLRYEGHPGLWHLGLYGLSRLTRDPLAMQLLHLWLATGTVVIFLKFAPFTSLAKTLFVFGYFPFFEYAAISRNYAAGLFLIFAFCAIFPSTFRRKFLVLCGLLCLLAQTSVYGLFLALPLGLALLAATVSRRSFSGKPPKFEFLAGLALLACGLLLSLMQLAPPPDAGFAPGWKFDPDWPHFMRVVGTIWASFVPIPAAQYHFWGTNIIPGGCLKFLLSLLLLAFPWFLFLNRPLVLGLYALGTLEILTFSYTKYFGSLRHHGHLFILFLACLWLSSYFPEQQVKRPLARGLTAFCRRNRDRFLVVLLGAQLLAGLTAYGLDLFHPFSAGRETARYIKKEHLDRLLLAGDEDDAASVVAGYLHRQIYYPASGRWGTFVVWDRQRQSLKDSEVLAKTRELAANRRRDVLLILNRELAAPAFPVFKVQQFTDSIVPAERYYLYLVKSGR